MTDERRYSEAEVAEILDLALRSDDPGRPDLAGEGGQTLRELQEIGREAGIDPRRIAEAAVLLNARTGVLRPERFLGMPLSVGRVIDLPRALTDREWEIVVAELRSTFAAPGQVGSQGQAREWSNGNLRVLLEPTGSGHQLRLSTLNRRLRLLAGVGAAELLVGLVFLVILVPQLLTTGGLSEGIIKLLPSIVVVGAGASFLAWARLSLPRWALERASQMEHMAVQVRALIHRTESEDPEA